MRWRAAVRRHERVLAVVLDAHQRRLAQLAALIATGGDQDDRQPGVTQCVGLLAAGALVGLDLLAHPRRRTRLVFTLKRHGSNLPTEQIILAVGGRTSLRYRASPRAVLRMRATTYCELSRRVRSGGGHGGRLLKRVVAGPRGGSPRFHRLGGRLMPPFRRAQSQTSRLWPGVSPASRSPSTADSEAEPRTPYRLRRVAVQAASSAGSRAASSTGLRNSAIGTVT